MSGRDRGAIRRILRIAGLGASGLIASSTPLLAETPSAPEPGPSAGIETLKEGRSEVDLLNAPGLSRGVDAIVAEIRKREVEIALREQRVAERERSVADLEAMIEKRAGDLDRIRQEVEGRITDWTQQGPDRVAQLADVYSAMPPVRAGALLEKLDLDLAVSVVRTMKKKKSAAVLSAMRPDRALMVSRRMLKPLDPTTDAPAARGN